ncbi:hypothetical protein J2W33_000379 [Variovorax boronicumulans]|nr:hypothetical protein [Variovorax boronicumulans]MDQ0039499.1 hypothetical protein [Variovorax boronicumulans]
MLFAHLNRIMRLDRLRLRGLSGAQDEFLMAATAQNLKRMAKWWMPSEADTGMKTREVSLQKAATCSSNRQLDHEPVGSPVQAGFKASFSTQSACSSHEAQPLERRLLLDRRALDLGAKEAMG